MSDHPTTESGRQMPASLEAERFLLGSILVQGSVLDVVLPMLRAGDFFLGAHGEIWDTFVALAQRQEPIDYTSVTDDLRKRGALPKLEGGTDYLLRLAGETTTVENVEHWAHKIVEKANVRRLISIAGEIQAKGYGDYGDYDEFVDGVEASVFAVSQSTTASTTTTSRQSMGPLLEELERRAAEKKEISGIPTGITLFDQMTGGLQPEHFIVIAARPGLGKTSWAMNIVANAAIRHKIPCFVLSLEMGQRELLERLLSAESDVPAEALRKGLLDQSWRKIYPAATKIADANIVIDDQGAQTITEIAAKCRRFRANTTYFPPQEDPNARPPPGLIVVDYLQLARSSTKAGKAEREQQVGEITRGLKALAKALKVPIIGISQLNRDVVKREDKRPHLHDLRESGSIEQDADVVVFIHRDDAYAEADDLTVVHGQGELLVRKNRHGDLGRVFVTWRKDVTRFENYTEEQMDLYPGTPNVPRSAPPGYAARDPRLPREDGDDD